MDKRSVGCAHNKQRDWWAQPGLRKSGRAPGTSFIQDLFRKNATGGKDAAREGG
jgi:hypothetical protein